MKTLQTGNYDVGHDLGVVAYLLMLLRLKVSLRCLQAFQQQHSSDKQTDSSKSSLLFHVVVVAIVAVLLFFGSIYDLQTGKKNNNKQQ